MRKTIARLLRGWSARLDPSAPYVVHVRADTAAIEDAIRREVTRARLSPPV